MTAATFQSLAEQAILSGNDRLAVVLLSVADAVENGKVRELAELCARFQIEQHRAATEQMEKVIVKLN